MDKTFYPGSTVPMPFFKHNAPDAARSALYLPGPNRQSPRSPTVVVVDYDAAVRDALSSTLRSSGFSVAAYGSAKELLSNVSMERNGCLLIEYDLKDMTGIELLARLTARQINLPAVIMSGRLKPLVFEAPRPPGVAAILQKPFGRDALLRCLQHALGHP